MGNKVTEELISTVRSIVGVEFPDMDIIRALHMANNDPTAAINIIFDAPRSFKKPDFTKKAEQPSNRNPNAEPMIVDSGVKKAVSRIENTDSRSRLNATLNSRVESKQEEGNDEINRGVTKGMGNEWWFVGSGEVAGLSTCKGRILKPGDEVNFTFPVEKKLKSPTSGKIGGGRGRQVATCSEIVRFSTNGCGEVLRIFLSEN